MYSSIRKGFQPFGAGVEGGIGIIEMNYKTNMIAFVGTGKNPLYPANKVNLWDDKTKSNIAELTFKTDVKGVKIRKEKYFYLLPFFIDLGRFAVVLEEKVFLYSFFGFKFIQSYQTGPNPHGLLAADYSEKTEFFAWPDIEIGKIFLSYLFEKNDAEQFRINIHESTIVMIEVSRDGNFIASASEKVTKPMDLCAKFSIAGHNHQTVEFERKKGCQKPEARHRKLSFLLHYF